jgi:predicted MFS family arabinose efflux permease
MDRALAPSDGWWRRLARRPGVHLTVLLGGPERRRTVLLLAAVLSLSSADSGTIGALAPQLEASFKIGNIKLGLLLTVSSLIGAAATLPMGVLVDRSPRVRLLVASVGAWMLALIASGLAVNYLMLLLTRVALGAVLAVAGPAVASLTGDLFPGAERARIYGYILTGELVGAGAGLLVAGNIGAALGWRAAFFVLVAPCAALAVALHRLLREPARGGQSRMAPTTGSNTQAVNAPPQRRRPLRLGQRVRARSDIEPDSALVLHDDPATMTPWAAIRYILRVHSNRALIASSALGYFFLAGLRAFAVLFARGHFGISQATVSLLLIVIGIGSVLGTLASGRLADRLIARGRLDARLLLAGGAFAAAAIIFVPGLLTTQLVVAIPLLTVAAGFLAAPNPPLDAARLDVMPARLWGRAESARTFVRSVLEAFAPLLFGIISQQLGGSQVNLGAGVNSSHSTLSPAATHGLQLTFLIMLVPLAASGAVLLVNRRVYLNDVATADASDHITAPPRQPERHNREASTPPKQNKKLS